MKIILKSMGFMRDYLGREPQVVVLPENSTLNDFLQWIETHHATRFPAFWNFQEHRFRSPVVLVINGKVALQSNAPLEEGLEVNVMCAVAGGAR